MAYQKQTWRDYDDTKTEVVNMNNGAVVTPERMNHIETGIANSADKAEVTAQLAQKVNQGNVSVNDINKNLGKFDQTYMTDEFLQQIVGETPLNAVPSDYSITTKKLTFNPLIGKKGKNLFNKDAVTSNFYINSVGNLISSSGWWVSDFIPVSPSTDYIRKTSGSLNFYDVDKNWLSNQSPTLSISTPVNCSFIRINGTNLTDLDIEQLELGNVSTEYESFVSLDVHNIKPKSIPIEKLVDYVKSKNLFNKDTALINHFINTDDGEVRSDIPDYFASELIEVEPSTNYYIYVHPATRLRITSYDKNKSYIGNQDNNESRYTTLPNANYIRFTSTVDGLENAQVEKGDSFTGFESFNAYKLQNLITKGNDTTASTKKLYTLNDAWTSWLNGEKFPIAFFSDSTTDGADTTGNVPNALGTDNISPNAYPKKLEEKLRSATGNNNLRIYNAGFSGRESTWGVENIELVFGESTPYNDVKMIGIGFGINDRVKYGNEKTYRNGFKSALIEIIDWCFVRQIQPFLLTTQPILNAGVSTQYEGAYAIRTGMHAETVANEVKRELSQEYDLELLDLNRFAEKYVYYSNTPLSVLFPTPLHFGDVGHEYEAGLFFSLINPQTIFIDGYCRLDYSNQRIVKSVADNLLTFNETDIFKLIANYTKTDATDTLIYKVYIYNNSNKQLSLKAYKSDLSSLTYVKVNDVTTTLDELEKSLGTLEIGLHSFEVWSGTSNLVDFKGFVIE